MSYTLLATHTECTGGRYYTTMTYKWFSDGDVQIDVTTGDDDRDYIDRWPETSTSMSRFDSLEPSIQDALKTKAKG